MLIAYSGQWSHEFIYDLESLQLQRYTHTAVVIGAFHA